MANNSLAGIYIHIPFCLRKCHYCDFYSITDLSLIPDFVLSLIQEITWRGQSLPYADSVYFGGGTPSVLCSDQIRAILHAVRSECQLASDAEITIEANPKTVDRKSLDDFRSMGINRINFGIQTFNDDCLNLLGRLHSAQDGIDCIRWAKKAGFNNIGIDLIYGIPYQTELSWRSDLQKALDLNPDHLSCYMLTYELGSVLFDQAEKGIIKPLEDNICVRLFFAAKRYLTSMGYEHYEISNYAKSSFRSRHNQKYWTSAPYIGMGPSAHSFHHSERYWNHRSIRCYLDDIRNGILPTAGRETLTTHQQMIESIFLGFRTSDGVNFERFYSRFGLQFDLLFGKTLDRLISKGFIQTDSSRACLTHKGMIYHDSVTSMLVNELEDEFDTNNPDS